MKIFQSKRLEGIDFQKLSIDGRVEYCEDEGFLGFDGSTKSDDRIKLRSGSRLYDKNAGLRLVNFGNNRVDRSKILGAQRELSVQHSIYGKAPLRS